MKHRALRMLLTLVMVVSLLPIAAIANGAEENTGAEEQKETVEMRENDSQQVGDGEKSQLPTEENENEATVLRLGAESAAATVYTAYQSEVLVLPVLYYTKDNVVINATEELFQKMGDVKCYAIQKNIAGRTLFGNLMLRPGDEFNDGNLILWNQLPEDWSGVDSASYVLMFHCNNQWYKLDAQLRAGSAPLVGELVLQYNGTNYSGEDEMILPAGVHQVALTLRTKNGERQITSEEKLSWSDNITKMQKFDGDNALWQLWLAEPEGETASGYIEYVNDDTSTSRVNITCIRSYGDEVTGEVIEQDSDEYAEISDNLVTPFDWEGETYYLGTAEYQKNLGDVGPYSKYTRGVIREDGAYQDMFFAPRVFEYGEGTYKLREDVRKDIENAGYVFKLELLPTDHGCAYYPLQIPVELENYDPTTDSTVTETWEQHLVTEKSIGSWVYKVSIVKKDNEETVLAENLSMASYQGNTYDYVTIETNDAEEIKNFIEEYLKKRWNDLGEEISDLVETGLYNDFVVFQLPSGEINGQIEIPDTLSLVTLRGAGFKGGLISTTIRGGVKLGDISCNIDGVHFIGNGITNEYLADGVTRNSAIYGEGQGVYNHCIFENYYCAIHSSEDCAPAWGGWSSVFYKNGTALHLDTDLGGNLEMVDNWFVGNSTAILMDDALEEIYFLQARQNRFVNNGCDLANNCGKTMWMSQNFFYHAAGSEASWEPVLWEEVRAENSSDIIGLRLKREGANGAILAEDMPAFEATENYNTLGADGNPQYLDFLPRFDGSSKTMAYPLARTQECVSFFYPNWRDPDFCPQWWPDNDPYYPSYVQQGVTISENELDGLRFSSYDSASDTAVGTFDFGSSRAETEH